MFSSANSPKLLASCAMSQQEYTATKIQQRKYQQTSLYMLLEGFGFRHDKYGILKRI